jgi:hypothetical protein
MCQNQAKAYFFYREKPYALQNTLQDEFIV